MVERVAHNVRGLGSNPSRSTTKQPNQVKGGRRVSVIPSIKTMLLRLASENEGVNGYRMAAGVVLKKSLISIGVNHRKTHPIMMNSGYRDKQVFLHAEADAIKNALRVVPQGTLTKASIYVVRLKKDREGRVYEGLAKPCQGCMNLILQYGFKEVEWTEDGQDVCFCP